MEKMLAILMKDLPSVSVMAEIFREPEILSAGMGPLRQDHLSRKVPEEILAHTHPF